MQRIGEVLSRVLADLEAQFPQEEKGGIRAAVIAPGHRETVGGAERKIAGGTGGQCFKSSADAFTADHSLPAQRVTGPKSTAGGKRW